MASNKDLRKIYRILTEIVFGIILYMISFYIKNYTYNLVSIIFSFSLLGLALLDIILFYFFEAKKNFKKHEIKYLFIGALIIILILSFILYLIIGLVTGFYIAIFTGLVSYVIALCVTLANKKRKK